MSKTSPIAPLLFALLSLATIANCQDSASLRSGTASAFLDQSYPGNSPELFAKSYLAKDGGPYANVTFHPELQMVCWTPNTSNDSLYKGGLFLGERKNNTWMPYKELRFLNADYGHRSPFFSADGKRLYFQGFLKSNEGWDQFEKFYYVEMTGGSWSEPTLLDTLFNKYAVHWQFSLDRRNNLYFSGDLRGVENTGGIYCSYFENGSYREPVLLFSNKHYGDAVFGPAISPDADYLLFTRIHPRGYASPRIFSLYVCFRNMESGWGEPKDLGEILQMDANQARISPDGNYIFFIGNDGYSYWVNSGILGGI